MRAKDGRELSESVSGYLFGRVGQLHGARRIRMNRVSLVFQVRAIRSRCLLIHLHILFDVCLSILFSAFTSRLTNQSHVYVVYITRGDTGACFFCRPLISLTEPISGG